MKITGSHSVVLISFLGLLIIVWMVFASQGTGDDCDMDCNTRASARTKKGRMSRGSSGGDSAYVCWYMFARVLLFSPARSGPMVLPL